jgi:cytoskeletal protein CcmA (bactofilin family)
VSGAIHAIDRVELQATAVVTGDILTARIAIVEGAKVSGEVKMDPSRMAGDVGAVAR